MAYIPSSGSVVAFQGTVPWVITGSVQGSFSPSGNQSVSGTVGASIIGLPPFVIGGSSNASVITVGTAVANQSVSGAINVSSLISMPGIISSANSTTSPVTSTLSFTGTSEEWKDFGSIVLNVFTDAASGTDGLSIQQSSNGTNWDITDTYTVPSMIAGQGKTFQVQPAARFGRVVYTQGAVNSGVFRLQTIYHPQMVKPTSQRPQDAYTNETDLEQQQGFNMVFNGSTWDRQRGTTSGTAIYGSVVAVLTSPSIIAVQGGIQVTSLVSTVPSSVIVGASIFGQLPAGTAVLGSITALQGTNPWLIGSVYGNISGSVVGFQGGTWSTSVMTNVITSIATAGQVMGSVAALQATNPWIVNFQNSSIIAINAGSIITIPSGSVVTVWKDSSVLAVPVGSVITVFQAPSIVGTYAEDAASASGDKGFLVMGARNDTLASVTSADGDYSSHVVGPAGELIAENAPLTKWVSGTASMLGGTPVTGSLVPVIAAQGASVFTYITGLQIANASATNVWITLLGGTNSVIGFTVAPANGGSNIYYQNGIKTNANAAFSASVSAVASVYLSAQGFISKT